MTRWLLVAALLLTGCSEPPPEPAVDDGPLRTVFLGDSITRGVSAETLGPSEAESWVTYAVDDDRSPWVLDANAGVFGDTLGQMAARFQAEVVDAGAPAVVVMGGTNDVLRGTRMHLDYRQRLTGNALPASGPTLTIASDF